MSHTRDDQIDMQTQEAAVGLQAVYTVKQLANISGVKPRTLRRWIKSGKIRPLRVGKLVFVPINSLCDDFPELLASICTKTGLMVQR